MLCLFKIQTDANIQFTEKDRPLALSPSRSFFQWLDKSRLITWRFNAVLYKADDVWLYFTLIITSKQA
jgi:hypothetical protein